MQPFGNAAGFLDFARNDLRFNASTDLMRSGITGPGWDCLPEGGPCETPPAVAQLRVVAAPRAMLAQDRDLDLRSRRKRGSALESKT